MNRWVQYNPNPRERRVGDCAIRACCKATGRSWDEVYWDLSNIAFDMADGRNSSNKVWREYPERNGFVRVEPDYPMDVYKFCCNFPHGTYWQLFRVLNGTYRYCLGLYFYAKI